MDIYHHPKNRASELLKRKEYIRDGRAPIPVKESTSEIMSSNKGRNTKPELILRKALWNSGIKGYRLHWKRAPGRPDIAFPGKKVAVFVNGCFWHRCTHCNPPMPKSNTDFWMDKFEKNKERDQKKINQLREIGWKTITVWECQVKKDLGENIERIKTRLEI